MAEMGIACTFFSALPAWPLGCQLAFTFFFLRCGPQLAVDVEKKTHSPQHKTVNPHLDLESCQTSSVSPYRVSVKYLIL